MATTLTKLGSDVAGSWAQGWENLWQVGGRVSTPFNASVEVGKESESRSAKTRLGNGSPEPSTLLIIRCNAGSQVAPISRTSNPVFDTDFYHIGLSVEMPIASSAVPPVCVDRYLVKWSIPCAVHTCIANNRL